MKKAFRKLGLYSIGLVWVVLMFYLAYRFLIFSLPHAITGFSKDLAHNIRTK